MGARGAFDFARGRKRRLAHSFIFLNVILIALATTAVLGVHHLSLANQALGQEIWRARDLAGTLADFSARYVHELRIGELQIALAQIRSSSRVIDAVIVASDGSILADGLDDNSGVLRDLSSDPLIAEALGTHDIVQVRRPDELEIVQPIAFASRDVGAVRLRVSLSEMQANLRQAGFKSILIGLASILVGAIATTYSVRQFTQTLGDLTANIRSVASGRYGRVELEGGERELVDLADAFNMMSEELLEKEERIERLIYFDPLTALPNRRRLQQVLEQLSAPEAEALWPEAPPAASALMILDLDLFKRANDTFGHAAGDALLVAVARRLTALLDHRDAPPCASDQPTRMAFRLGGDEFVCVLARIGRENARRIGDAIVAELSRPYDIDGNRIDIGASVGVAFLPDDATDAPALLEAADVALYQAKKAGRGLTRLYESGTPAENPLEGD